MNTQLRIIRTAAIAILTLVAFSTSRAQSRAERIAFGIDGGGNKYYGNYTDNQFAFHGDAFIRWNIMDWLSLHAAYNGGQLRYKATAASVANSGGALGTLNHTRVGGWDLMLSYNFFTDDKFVPYVIAGGELLNFEPKDASDMALKNNAAGVYNKNVFGGVVGVGFEMYISDYVVFNGKALLHLSGTDWLDDYSDPNNSRQDAFITMGVGFSYYVLHPFIPEKEPAPTPTVSERPNVTNVTNVYPTTVYRVDTIYIQGPRDTVYLTQKPKVGTVFFFPGTLFIVNTDEFNNSVPDNVRNLYNIRTIIDQCPEMKVEIMGHASNEGPADRNQELSQLRADRVKQWLLDQGVDPNKIVSAIGYGTRDNAVREPANGTSQQIEEARVLNRRVAVRVVQTCK